MTHTQLSEPFCLDFSSASLVPGGRPAPSGGRGGPEADSGKDRRGRDWPSDHTTRKWPCDSWPTLTAHVSEPSPEQEIRGAGRALSSGGRPRAPALGISGEQERCDQGPTSLANLGAPEDQILWSFHVSHVEEFMHPCRVFLSFCFN